MGSLFKGKKICFLHFLSCWNTYIPSILQIKDLPDQEPILLSLVWSYFSYPRDNWTKRCVHTVADVLMLWSVSLFVGGGGRDFCSFSNIVSNDNNAYLIVLFPTRSYWPSCILFVSVKHPGFLLKMAPSSLEPSVTRKCILLVH